MALETSTKSRQFSPFCETSDVPAQKAILEARTPNAEKFIAEAKAQGGFSANCLLDSDQERIVAVCGFFFGFSSSEKFKTSPLVSAHPS